MNIFTLRQNDTLPPLQAILSDVFGNPVNLTGASVTFRMVAFGTITPLIVNAAATVTEAMGGAVQYNWQAADTALSGAFDAIFKVTFGDGTIETFINSENIRIHIVPTF